MQFKDLGAGGNASAAHGPDSFVRLDLRPGGISPPRTTHPLTESDRPPATVSPAPAQTNPSLAPTVPVFMIFLFSSLSPPRLNGLPHCGSSLSSSPPRPTLFPLPPWHLTVPSPPRSALSSPPPGYLTTPHWADQHCPLLRLGTSLVSPHPRTSLSIPQPNSVPSFPFPYLIPLLNSFQVAPRRGTRLTCQD